ncbi:alpha/beta hydrolase [Lentzea sp. JNUCC 0626]|uniref:alpha/beta hydrolase n=1 Tax=Lentzea sp. JNUCC 0626 TaxID=3367513 RepID=UPI003749176D
MSFLSKPWAAATVARGMQWLMPLGSSFMRLKAKSVFPEHPGNRTKITIPTSIAPARAVVYRPAEEVLNPPVYVNFHGGGFVMRGIELDDPLCRFLAAEAGVVVINVDYAVAPKHKFPDPIRQAYETVRWIAAHSSEHGWDGSRLAVGGQSAGGAIAAGVARLAWELGGPRLSLQVLHYPPLDLTTPARNKGSIITKPMLSPWMGDVFDNAYAPDADSRSDRLASPAADTDTTDLRGIAPCLVITAEHDRLHNEGRRYAERLKRVGALLEHRTVLGADHAYDMSDRETARTIYTLIASHVRRSTSPTAGLRFDGTETTVMEPVQVTPKDPRR